VYVSDFHSVGGLVLASSPTESLWSSCWQRGIRGDGYSHEATDRIGASCRSWASPLARGLDFLPRRYARARHAAGRKSAGDTNNDGSLTTAKPGDWNSVKLDEYAADRNVETLYEDEARDVNSPGPNGTPDGAQLLGTLGPKSRPATKIAGWASPSRAS